jgi:hypothetical protein
MNEDFNHLYGEFETHENHLSFLDDWMKTQVFTKICEEADAGDEDSMNFVSELLFRIDSLMFHVENQTSEQRVAYELNSVREFIKPFVD